jgi:glutathione synthase/RimK-type ligase-like ATP-grasp enzyme
MKKILILVDSIGHKKELFAEAIAKDLGMEVTVSLSRFSDITIDLDGKDIIVKIEGEDIRSFDLVYFRRVGDRFFSLGGTVAICLKHFGVPFYDTAFEDVGPDEDKFTNQTRLALAGLPIVPSFFCWHERIEDNKKYIIQRFGLPLVAKSLGSHRGNGVFLLKKEEDFGLLNQNDEKSQFLFQKYLPNDMEYRLLVLKDRVAVAEKKIRTDPNEFRSNVALGAKEEFFSVSELSTDVKDMAVLAAKTLKIQTAGVDVLIEKGSNKHWLLEVNRGPGLTYDTKVSPELSELAKFFKRELEGK